MEPVIPPKKNHKVLREYDKDLYKARHLVENAFLYLKQWRGIATRYAKIPLLSWPLFISDACFMGYSLVTTLPKEVQFNSLTVAFCGHSVQISSSRIWPFSSNHCFALSILGDCARAIFQNRGVWFASNRWASSWMIT